MSRVLHTVSFERHRLDSGCFLSGEFRNDGDETIPPGGLRLIGRTSETSGLPASLVNFWPIPPGKSLHLSLAWPFAFDYPDLVSLVDYVGFDGKIAIALGDEVSFSPFLGKSTITRAER